MNGIDHMETALSVGVQKMVRADLAGAGVLFTLDTESGCPNVILINASWGLGEYVVKGLVNPDQYLVFKGLADETDRLPIIDKILGNKDRKLIYASEEASGAPGANANALPSAAGTTRSVDARESERRAFVLSDQEIEQLARWAVAIERRFGVPMDIEWAKDGLSGALYILQARPETVHARKVRGMLRSYSIPAKGEPLLTGVSVGNSIAAGPVALVTDATELDLVQPGSILVARMTDPDWVPAMRRAAGVVTETGGRTCHAAIVSREIGIPAVIGAERATELLGPGDPVTVSCAEGEKGFVYAGLLDIHTTEIDLSTLPATKTRVMLNLASPESAMRWWQLPSDGVGLARMEFIISEWIRIHPMALVRFKELDDPGLKEQISAITAGYDDKTEYFVEKLAAGIARLAAPHHPKIVIVRTSDFKTNEYANLIAGRAFEPEEENPMIGWRGASRYYSPEYREAFALECRAIRRVREEKGLENLAVMIPFCRTVEEADRVLMEMEKHGLRRGAQGLRIFMMCEIPSNVVLADQFARRFDGFSIGSNDLTQLVLGIDRDSSRLSYLFDERNEAVQSMIREVIQRAHAASATVGICGEAPSNYPEFVDFLVASGIDSMSVEPDSFAVVKQRTAAAEARGVESAAEHLLETPKVSTLVDEFGRFMPGDTP
jgi:pyruvate,water dikinase